MEVVGQAACLEEGKSARRGVEKRRRSCALQYSVSDTWYIELYGTVPAGGTWKGRAIYNYIYLLSRGVIRYRTVRYGFLHCRNLIVSPCIE